MKNIYLKCKPDPSLFFQIEPAKKAYQPKGMPLHVRAVGVFVGIPVLARIMVYTRMNREPSKIAPGFSAGLGRIRLLYNPREAQKYLDRAKVED